MAAGVPMTDAVPGTGPTARGAAPPLLAETAAAVWPEAERIELTRSPRPPAGATDHLVLPRPGGPRWLLPVADRRAGAALGDRDEAWARRAATTVVATAHRWGAARWLPVPRLRVVGGDGVGPVGPVGPVDPVDPDGRGDPDDLDGAVSLPAALRAMSGAGGDAAVALRLGSWEHARSVVARILDTRGATVAFAKAGIDEHGRAAVTAEAHALDRLDGLHLPSLRRPRVLHRGTWRGLDVLVVSPLVARGPTTGRGMPLAAMRELAASATREGELGTSGWRRRTGEGVQAVTDAGHRERLSGALARIDAAARDLALRLGPAHGDWTAWNMEWDGDTVLLWDWEHFGEDAPIGLDPVHYLAQELRVGTGTDEAAERLWRRRSEVVLADELGLDAARRDLVRAAYLLEVNLRFVLDRQGTALAAVPRAGWGLDLLAAETARLGR